MGTRRKSRELVLQMLFQADMGRQSPDDVRRIFWKERSAVLQKTCFVWLRTALKKSTN